MRNKKSFTLSDYNRVKTLLTAGVGRNQVSKFIKRSWNYINLVKETTNYDDFRKILKAKHARKKTVRSLKSGKKTKGAVLFELHQIKSVLLSIDTTLKKLDGNTKVTLA
jgi:hypothetical protein